MIKVVEPRGGGGRARGARAAFIITFDSGRNSRYTGNIAAGCYRTGITAGCSSVTLIKKAVTLNEGVRGTRRKGGNVVARRWRDDVHHAFVE